MNKFIVISCAIVLSLVFVSGCKTKTKHYTKEDHEAFKNKLVQANKGLVNIDQDRIQAYVRRHGWDMKVLETGMWYQIIESDGGEKASEGKVAHLKYQVSLLDGTICYSSDSLGDMKFKIGYGGVESGLEDAILMMKVGDKGRFIMPPHLAHGLLGDENKIPARTIIVYQTELLNLTDY